MRRIRHIAFVLALLVVPTLFVNGHAQQNTRSFETGLNFATQDEYKALPIASTPLMGTLPAKIDLSTSFPSVNKEGQGPQGSCVGWAIAYALKSYQERLERNWPFSERTVFSPAYIYNSAKEPGTCKTGTYYAKALKFVQENGAARWSDFGYDPSDCSRKPTAQMRQDALPFRIASYSTVNFRDIIEMKSHLAAGEPVLIGMWVDADFQNLCPNCVYQGLRSSPLGGHAIVVTGYDDEKGAFRIVNSWGGEWSSNGYGWISYTGFSSTTPTTVLEAYVATDSREPLTLSAPGGGGGENVSYEVVYRQYQSIGRKTASPVVTEDRHCSSNCQGEPTRKNYVTTLVAEEGILRRPELHCHGSACPWSGVLFIRLEAGDKKVVGSWDVWGRPTTWELSAEQVKIVETRRESAEVAQGQEFEVVGEENEPPPVVTWRNRDGGTMSYEPGQSVLRGLAYLGRREVGGVPAFRFRFGS